MGLAGQITLREILASLSMINSCALRMPLISVCYANPEQISDQKSQKQLFKVLNRCIINTNMYISVIRLRKRPIKALTRLKRCHNSFPGEK